MNNSMKQIAQIFTLAIVILFAGCDRNANQAKSWSFGDGEAVVSSESFGFNTSESANSDDDRKKSERSDYKTGEKIIRTAHIGIRLRNYDRDKHAIYDAIEKYEAYVSSENERNETYRISNDLQIRVPNDKFDKLIADLTAGEGVHNIDYKRINSQDVGEKYFDIATRLKTKKAVEQQYLDILKQAKTIKDILAVQEEIRQLREEIESAEGQIRFLSDQIRFSTVNLSVYQNLENGSLVEKPGFFNKLKNAFQSGWKGLISLFLGIVHLWPFVILIVGLIWLIRKRRLFGWRKSTKESS